MSEHRLLTKSEFVRGLDCVRRPWLDLHRPGLKEPLSLAAKDRMETGRVIGELARTRYRNGLLVWQPGMEAEAAASKTRAALEAGANCIFEATFIAAGRLARVDVLHRDGSGAWTVDEAKSVSLKDPKKLEQGKMLDLAFQFHTARDAGLDVRRARLILVDNTYVWDGSDFDPNEMLGVVDLTDPCEKSGEMIREQASKLAQVMESDREPEVELNTHCKVCDYFDHCHANSPKHDLIFLPHITPKAVIELRNKGYGSIADIPEDEDLTAPRRRMRDVIVSNKPFVGEGLGAALDSIPFPAAFIDYETSNPAFPTYAGTHPYQQICFQWSAHVMSAPDSVPSHAEYLPQDSEDPRPGFCATLWETVKDCPAIVHYSHFERTQLKAMVAQGIPLAAELLEAIETRTIDLERIILDHVYLEGFKGRSSIKVVLPTLVPNMTYDGMLIGDGQAAAAGFRKMLATGTPEDEAKVLRRALLDYCCLDTLAMVEIYRALRQLAKANP